MQEYIQYGEEVLEALASKKPIVALESTIITHGMPFPHNLETAILVENIIRETGATPATIACHRGKIRVGLDSDFLEYLSQCRETVKASRRDIAFILSQKLTASTTVAATMFFAHKAGLPIFVTGGIGGVHYLANESYDVSADLIELANTPVTVICSGAKSILDLPKTLEVLETHGVPVIGYKTNEFPAFYSHSSGIPLLHRLDCVHEIAKLMHTQHQLNLNNGIIIANPIPEVAEIPHDQIQEVIAKALQESKHVRGKAITPFLLNRINELTQGKSLQANIELIKNNAFLGTKIAIAYQDKKKF